MLETFKQGDRVRKARKLAKLSQVELAKLCNVTQATVQKIETGRSANSRFLPKIYAQLGLPLSELDPAFGTRSAPQSRARKYTIEWNTEPPVWHAYDVVDLQYGRAINKETGREGVAIMWRLRDGSYLIGVADVETLRKTFVDLPE